MTASFNLKEKFTKKKLLENIGLKITSLFIAIGLWLIVVNITDPTVSAQIRNVPVRIVNADVITSAGKTLEVIDNTDFIPLVTVKAPRTIIQDLGTSADNIVATADMRNLSSDGESVSIEFTTTKYADKIETIRATDNVLKVSIENKKTVQLPLYATTSGEIEGGYILGNVEPNQNQVRVSGPESVVSQIKSASVDVQVTGFTSDISTQADIALYDADGIVIPQSNLDLNVTSVRVDVEILATKKVPVYFATSGVPAEGYAVTGEIECSPEVVVIAGAKNVIDKVTEISIPSSELNITGQSENMHAVIGLGEYLPAGIRLGDSSYNGKASITVYIEPIIQREFEIATKEIRIENVPEEFEVAMAEKEGRVVFSLSGLAQDLEKIDVSKLNCRLDFDDFALLVDDLSSLKDGRYKFYVVMDLPEGVELCDTVGVLANLTSKEDK